MSEYYNEKPHTPAEPPKPGLVRYFKYIFPVFLILLALFFGWQFDEWPIAIVMGAILAYIAYRFIGKPGIKSDL